MVVFGGGGFVCFLNFVSVQKKLKRFALLFPQRAGDNTVILDPAFLFLGRPNLAAGISNPSFKVAIQPRGVAL